jgi:nicotinate-nucleotide--dimethylbenzimidazole phosphoribosyltransferase
MLELMVEELTAAMPARPAPEEIVETTSLPDPEPAEAAATPNAVVTEPEPIPAEAPASPEPVPETNAFTPDEPITVTEVSASPEPVAVTASAPQESTSTAEQEPVSTAETAATFESKIPEVELLSSFARMETMPFLPPEVGTAVIFESRVKSDTTAEGLSAQQAGARPAAETVEPQPAALPEPNVIMPPVDLSEPSERETSPQPDTPPEQTLQASAAPAPETSAGPPPPEPVAELDLHVLLFETQFEADDPAATLLEPAWPAQDWPAQDAAPARAPAAAAQPAAQQPQDKPADPLGPLKAMSDEEKIALFE